MFIFILCYATPVAFAADIVSLLELARDADPALRSVHFDGKVAEELHKQSTASFLPVVTGQYQYQRTKQKILRSDNAVFGHGQSIFPTRNWTATLTQPVFHADAWYDFSKTKLGKIRSDLDFIAAQQDLMVRIVDAYLNALASEKDHTLAVAELEMLKSELKSAKIKYDNGLSAVSELRDVQARSAEVEAQVAATKAAVRDAREKLRSMVGISVGSLDGLRTDAVLPEIDLIDVDKQVKQALIDNYTVRSHQIAVEISKRESSRLYAQHLPTVDLIARYNRRDTKGSLFGGGSKVDTGDIILQVDVPIFSGGRTQSQAREAVYRGEQAKQDLEAARRSVERDMRSGYASLLSDTEKISSLQHVLAAKRSLYELKREGYKTGLNSIQDKLETQRDLYSAERDLVAARYDHLLDYVKIKQASGQLNQQDMVQMNALLSSDPAAVNRLSDDATDQSLQMSINTEQRDEISIVSAAADVDSNELADEHAPLHRVIQPQAEDEDIASYGSDITVNNAALEGWL